VHVKVKLSINSSAAGSKKKTEEKPEDASDSNSKLTRIKRGK